MPIYEYECTCCPSRFELRRSFTENSAVSCPQCGGKARRLFSPVPIIFKGSGFYVTDSRGDRGRPPDKGDTGKTKAVSTTEAGSETKALTTTETGSVTKAVSTTKEAA